MSQADLPSMPSRARWDAPRTTLSSRYWNLDWSDVLPWRIGDVTVESGTFADAVSFTNEHYARIFQSAESSFLSQPMTDAKRRFSEEMDVLLFRAGPKVVGLLLGHPSDWSTYYMRSVALLPDYRGRAILTKVMERTYGPLERAGVERIEGECAPSNVPMMRMLVGQGFVLTSTATSERWGLVARFTKFLSGESQRVFSRQFCVTPLSPPKPPREGGRHEEVCSDHVLIRALD
jgi:hypothetical protein